jgi:hypothetical protein
MMMTIIRMKGEGDEKRDDDLQPFVEGLLLLMLLFQSLIRGSSGSSLSDNLVG